MISKQGQHCKDDKQTTRKNRAQEGSPSLYSECSVLSSIEIKGPNLEQFRKSLNFDKNLAYLKCGRIFRKPKKKAKVTGQADRQTRISGGTNIEKVNFDGLVGRLG